MTQKIRKTGLFCHENSPNTVVSYISMSFKREHRYCLLFNARSGGFYYRIKQMEISRFFFLESYSNKLQTTSSFIPEVEMRF